MYSLTHSHSLTGMWNIVKHIHAHPISDSYGEFKLLPHGGWPMAAGPSCLAPRLPGAWG